MIPIRLKNGTEAPDVVVAATMLSLRRLLESQPLALYELRELCRDPKHRIFGDLRVPLLQLGLIVEHGSGYAIHGTVRDIVLSALTGEGADMTLGNPGEG